VLIRALLDEAAETINLALAGQRHQLHGARLARLEAHRGTGGDVEPVARAASRSKARPALVSW
jgi:hypothetical protein